MKILSTPIEVLAHFENGTPHQVRFKLNYGTIRIEHVVFMTGEKIKALAIKPGLFPCPICL